MEQHIIDAKETSEIEEVIASASQTYSENDDQSHGLIIAGDSLLKITANSKL